MYDPQTLTTARKTSVIIPNLVDDNDDDKNCYHSDCFEMATMMMMSRGDNRGRVNMNRKSYPSSLMSSSCKYGFKAARFQHHNHHQCEQHHPKHHHHHHQCTCHNNFSNSKSTKQHHHKGQVNSKKHLICLATSSCEKV